MLFCWLGPALASPLAFIKLNSHNFVQLICIIVRAQHWFIQYFNFIVWNINILTIAKTVNPFM